METIDNYTSNKTKKQSNQTENLDKLNDSNKERIKYNAV